MAKRGSKGGGGSGGGGEGETNTGLIVGLVFFILVSITLGVLTYFGYSGQAELRTAAIAAKTASKEDKTKFEKEELKRAMLAVASGADEPKDQTTLNGLKNQYKTEFDQQSALLKDLPKWDPTTDRPSKTYADLFAELRQERDKAETQRKQANAAADDARKLWLEEKADLEAKLKKAQEAQKSAEEATVRVRQERDAALEKSKADGAALSVQLSKVNQGMADQKVDSTRDITKLESRVDNLQRSRDQVNQRIGPLMEKLEEIKNRYPELVELTELHRNLSLYFEQLDLVSSDTPKGEIQRIDRSNKIVYVNLGSADRVKTQMTFSILPADLNNKAGLRQRKGALEIVAVTEPHLSKARIIEETNPLRDPVLQGDKLYNPAFRAGQEEHVALGGLIDFIGDGRDHTAEIVAGLTRQGVVVDAWLDSSDLTIKGPGVSEKTTFFIIGERTLLSSTLPPQEGSKTLEVANTYNQKLRELEDKCKEFGAQKVTARRFLTMVGFPIPKSDYKADFASTSYLRGALTKPGNAPATDAKPK